jgi:secreted trypsin-like serine protease
MSFENKKLIAIGFGQTQAADHSERLLQVMLPYPEDNNFCKQSDKVICVSGEGTYGICHGDSGGPLMAVYEREHLIVVGLASLVFQNCGTPGYPDVFIKVGHYMEWILENIQLYN